MSSANVERVRRGYEAAAAGDYSLIQEMLDPEVKWHGGDPASGCQNRAQAMRFLQDASSRGPLGRLVDVLDAGDRVVVIMEPRRAPGAASELRANVTTFRDGRVVEMVAYETPAAAREAAGLPDG